MPFLPSSGVRYMSDVHGTAEKPPLAGILLHKDAAGKEICTNREIIVGRDSTRCQYVLHDPHVSKRHLRLYTVVYENDEPNEVDTLVYAEDLSRNGTYWNGSLIGQGNGEYLLSDGDVLKLSRNTYLVFTGTSGSHDKSAFDLTQECEMARFRNDYIITDRLLGAGAFGKVFMAIEQRTRVQVACKMVDIRKLIPRRLNRFGHPEQPVPAKDSDSRVQMWKLKDWINERKRGKSVEEKLKLYFREIEILASINHPNIIGIEKVFITNNTLYMMQNLVTAGDLFSYIESKNGMLLEVEAAGIIRQILVAVSFLHERNIVHRDIKPDNILMTSSSAGCRIVLTDFGAARRILNQRHLMSTQIGTHEYAAPEMLISSDVQEKVQNRAYTRAVDMWAVGCVAVVLLTGGLAFCDPVTNYFSEKLSKDCNLEFLQKSTDWQSLRTRPREFVENLLVLDEDARMTAEAALNHSWFSDQPHKTEFESLYQRTVKTWHPKPPKAPVVDFMDDGSIKHLSCSQSYLEKTYNKLPRKRRYVPVEEPYKPFSRTMHFALLPKRDVGGRLSDEILSAIENNWPNAKEPARAWEARLNNASNGQQSFRSCTAPTRRSRREPPAISLQKDSALSRLTLQSSPTMLRIPFRLRWDEKRMGDPTDSSLDANLSGILERNGTLMPETSRASQDEGGPDRLFTKYPHGPQQPKCRSPHSIRAWENSSKRQSEIKNSIELTTDTHNAGPRAESNADAQDFGRILKRKAPKLDLQLDTKRRRHPGSIYDLSDDDGDSDSDDVEASKQRLLVPDREGKLIYRHQPTSNI
ncbi:CAMK protein kinase [Exophiala aquamarina CBS 119918]|uniref:CAMK protein kinase n=1 Tax=Exophiala aquamarina CBS 119918 TaxID=1182545 RepID=A0A072PKC6_9EURO|nr:CAMK protein kinase [Exophiala aquamarina CBS 119918]KEF60574.1 CAMK protein kinase [Exophiala aquamarina CBS 119918]